MAGAGSVVFAITARDAASAAIGKVNKSLGGLGKAGQLASAGLGIAASAGAALATIGIAAAKAAMDDERDTLRLNAALKSRGLLSADLTQKINDQIAAAAELGFTDDQVRAGIEVGSRFFKKQSDILKVNAVAQNIAAVTGQDLAEVISAIGKGARGQTRGLTSLGISVKKGAKLQDILTAATAKYGGAAAEIAGSTSGKFAAMQIKLNEAFESLGYQLLPIVNQAFDFFSKEVMPRVQTVMSALGPVITGIAAYFTDVLAPAATKMYKDHIEPLIKSVSDLAVALWDNGNGPLAIALSAIGGAAEVLNGILGLVLDTIKLIVDAVTTALTLLGKLGDQSRANATKPQAPTSTTAQGGYAAGAYAGAMGGSGGSGYLYNNVSLTIGTQKQDELVSGSLRRLGSPVRNP